MKRWKATILLLIIGGLIYPASGADKKLAQTGFQFLSVGCDARAAGMANAMTTVELGSGSLFYNPAGMARLTNIVDLSFSNNGWIADIKHTTASLAFVPSGHRYGVIGISLQSVNYGDVEGTVVSFNDQGYIDTGIFNPSAYAVGVGYALALSDQFAVGSQIKYTGQHLGPSLVVIEDSLIVRKYKEFATAVDFGTIFHTGYKSVAFGMTIRNFSSEVTYEDEPFALPLTFTMGISMDVLDFFSGIGSPHSLYTTIDATHPRSYPEYINLGFEYSMNNMIYARYGYMQNRDERSSNFGVGVSFANIKVDYSYTPFGKLFDNVQRITLRFAI